jgi:hypothetical protein
VCFELESRLKIPSKTRPTGPRSENGNVLVTRIRADLRTSPSGLGHSYKPRRGGSAKCGAKRASRRASGGWVVVNPYATRGMDGAQRGLARCDVRDKIRQSEKAAGKFGAYP